MAMDNKRRSAATIERDHEAYELWLTGLSFRKIGAALNVAPQTASNMVTRSRERVRKEMTLDLVDAQHRELSRLDRLLAAIWVRATSGKDLPAMAEARHLIRERGRILGFGNPELHLHLYQAASVAAEEAHADDRLTEGEARARRLVALPPASEDREAL